MTRAYFDTEDNALELQEKGLPSWGKRCTEIVAIDDNDAQLRVKFNGKPNPEIFLDWLRRRAPVEAWCHNLDYDLSNLFPGRIDVPDISMSHGKITSARIPGVKFRDSSNLFPMTLSELGVDFGIPKLPPDDPQHCFRDVEIVRAAVCLAASQVEPWGVQLPGTVGGLSLALWRALGGKNWRCLSPIAREAFYGGRVELFRPYATGRILEYDSQSCYPACMMANFADRCDPWFGLGSKAKAMARLLSNRELHGVARCRVEWQDGHLAPLPVRYQTKDGWRMAFPRGDIQGVWDVAEIRAALRHGANLIDLREAWGSCSGAPYYKRLVQHCWLARAAAETPALELLYKLVMNNLFGQLGATGEVSRGLILERHSEPGAGGRRVPTRDGIPYGDRLLVDLDATPPPTTNWLHAAAIAAAGRVRMLTALSKLPRESLIYCATDCVFFEWPKGVASPFPETGQIGDFRFRGEHSAVVCLSPNTYRTTNVNGSRYVAKGVPKSKAAEFLENGKTGFWQPWRIRESIVHFDEFLRNDSEPVQHGVWRQIVKSVKFSKYGQKSFDGGFYWPHSSVALESINGPAQWKVKSH